MKAIIQTAALAATLTALSMPAMAIDTTLDFSGNICGAGGTAACSLAEQIGQSYGDIADLLDVSYRSFDYSGTSQLPYLNYYSAAAGGLSRVAWGGYAYTEFTFTALGGSTVSLNAFDIGVLLDNGTGSSASVIDLNTGNTLWTSVPFEPQYVGMSFSPNVSSDSGLILRWGPTDTLVGFDNIKLTVLPAEPPALLLSAVPEPETYALMLAGLGLVGFMARGRMYRG